MKFSAFDRARVRAAPAGTAGSGPGPEPGSGGHPASASLYVGEFWAAVPVASCLRWQVVATTQRPAVGAAPAQPLRCSAREAGQQPCSYDS